MAIYGIVRAAGCALAVGLCLGGCNNHPAGGGGDATGGDDRLAGDTPTAGGDAAQRPGDTGASGDDANRGDTAAGDGSSGDTRSGDALSGDTRTGDAFSGDPGAGDNAPAGCVDPDGDNYGSGAACLGFDCDESNPGIHAGATEIECDRVDQDCDGADLRPGGCVLATIDLGSTNIETGLVQNDGGDGLTQVVTRGGEPMRSYDTFMYFAVDDAVLFDGAPDQPIEIEIEYVDEGWGLFGIHYDSRNGTGIPNQYYWSEPELRTDSGVLRTWRFFTDDWRFANSQNQGSDFRLFIDSPGVPVVVNRVTILRGGARRDYAAVIPPDAVERVWGVGNPFVPHAVAPYRFGSARLLGATAVESYVRWRYIEPTEGVYDFADYDLNLDVIRRVGMRWAPFIIIGPGYSVPTWFSGDPTRHAPARCLEDNLDATDESIFNPALWPKIEAGLQAFASHYAPLDADIQSIMIGISGTYGESIYTAGGDPDNDGSHGHPGYWAADALAVDAFRSELEARYQTVANLDAAWGTSFAAFTDATTLTRAGAPNDRAWRDFVRFYHDAMSRHTEMWLDAARRAFPTQELVLVTGGGAQGWLGSDFDRQARTAGEYNAQIRITNEGSSQRNNLRFTAWVDAASRYYGATCSHEPASFVDAAHIAGRVFNAVRAGCYHHHTYHNNLRPPDAAQAGAESADQLVHATPLVETAMLIPRSHWLIHADGNTMPPQSDRGAPAIFDRTNVDFVSEGMVADGGLAGYRFAVLFDGTVWTREALAGLEQWVNSGGILIAAAGVSLGTIDNDLSTQSALFGFPVADQVLGVGLGRTYWFAGSLTGAGLDSYLDDIVATLQAEGSTQVGYDGLDDGVYTAVVEGAVILFNDTAAPMTRTIDGTTVTVPPARMATVVSRRGPYAQTEIVRSFGRQVTDGSPQRFAIRNDGTLDWTPTTFTLGYHLLDTSGTSLMEGRAGPVQSLTPPGGIASFERPLPNDLVATLGPGRYWARYDMVHEFNTWFAAQGAQPIWRRLEISGAGGAPPLDNPDFADGLAGWRHHGAGWRNTGVAVIHPLSTFEPSWVEQSLHLPATGTLRARVAIIQDDCATSDAIIALFVRVGHTWTKLDERLVAFADGMVELSGDLAPLGGGPYANLPGAVRVAARAGGAMAFCSEWASVDDVWIQ